MEKKKPTVAVRLTSLGLLITIIFLILKLTDTITWHWIWIFSPILITMGLNLVISLIKDIIKDFKEY